MEMSGARVLVTGASTGIGAAIAVALGERGATVGLVARRGELLAAVLETARGKGAGPASRYWAVDLADVDAAEQVAVEAWDHFGGLDGFVSNAGMQKRRHVLNVPSDELDRIMRVNFLAPAHMTLALLPRMVERGSGTVVFVGSVTGRVSGPSESSYVASKHALAGFAESVAVDLVGTPVVARLVTPGPFDTDLWKTTDDEVTHYTGPKYPPAVAADAIIGALEGTDCFETMVPEDIGAVIAMKNGDVDGWIKQAAGMAEAARSGRGA